MAGNGPSSTRPSRLSPAAEYFHSDPNGVPWPVEMKRCFPSGATPSPWGPSGSVGRMPMVNAWSRRRPAGPNRTSWIWSTASDATQA